MRVPAINSIESQASSVFRTVLTGFARGGRSTNQANEPPCRKGSRFASPWNTARERDVFAVNWCVRETQINVSGQPTAARKICI
jgi:hypothetical protein